MLHSRTEYSIAPFHKYGQRFIVMDNDHPDKAIKKWRRYVGGLFACARMVES